MSFPNINKLNMQTTQPNKNQSLEAKNPKESKRKISGRELLDLPCNYTISSKSSSRGINVSVEDLFNLQFYDATTLSDGSKLIRPVCLSLGKVDITPTENFKEYKMTIYPQYYSNKEKKSERTITEEELLGNKFLYKGNIRKATKEELKELKKQGKSNLKYVISYIDKDDVPHKKAVSESGCLRIFQENLLYM